jgi:hypothetical protein
VLNHIKKYHTLLERSSKDGKWYIAFGDYNKSLVKAELDELFYNHKIETIGQPRSKRRLKASLFKIITTADDKASIEKAVASENFVLKVQKPVEL